MRAGMVVLSLTLLVAALLSAARPAAASARFQWLLCRPPPAAGTWRILDRDGAGRRVEPYLSSLGLGESGRGVVRSPPFTVATDTIRMTLCGHDGPQGERERNFVALADAVSGEVLRKTFAPLSDPLEPRSWDVKDLRGRQVRFEAHDHDAEGAYAWLGVGEIDAGLALRIEFRQGLPEGWESAGEEPSLRTEAVAGAIPFRALVSRYSLVPESGVAEIPCGFQAERLYFLGCTVYRARPLDVCGQVEIVYDGGAADRYPLMAAFTLDAEFKLLGGTASRYLHRSGDPFQYWFVLRPRARRIDRIRLVAGGPPHGQPRITAVTCESGEVAASLHPLPAGDVPPEVRAWIESHAVPADPREIEAIREEIRRAHKLAQGEGGP